MRGWRWWAVTWVVATWVAALLVPLLYFYGCGSGGDDIDIICNNAGPGSQVCAATGGANVDVPVASGNNASPTPRR